ncbi:MFS transporter [Novosphingobium sp. AAP83]|uniref:MFS transporter n=1 Tax=Novosphingobium sp. AAP83 TaxID=1523425 RepID=UPI0006B8CC4D|nr:MFS transporter [Novosphingobium sp. AAP83]
MKGPLPLLLVLVFLNIAGFSLILPLLPFYGHAFAASPFAVACLFAAYSFGNVLGEIFWGRRSDALGRKPILVMTTAGAALSYVAFAFAPTLLVAIVIRVITGFFSGTLGVVQGMLADLTPPSERARFMGYFGASFNLGFAIGPAIGGVLASPELGLQGFYTPILAAAAFAGAASTWAMLALPHRLPQTGAQRAMPSYTEGLEIVASNPILVRLFVIAFIGIAAFSSVEAVFGLWTGGEYAWTSRQVGLTFLAVGGTGLLVQALLIGPLVKRFGESCVIAGGIVVLFTAIALLPVLRYPAITVALMALLMAGHSLAFPNAGALVSRNAPVDRQGSVMGLNMASNALSRIVAPPLFGWVFSLSNDAPFYLCALLMTVAFGISLSIIALQKKALSQ